MQFSGNIPLKKFSNIGFDTFFAVNNILSFIRFQIIFNTRFSRKRFKRKKTFESLEVL